METAFRSVRKVAGEKAKLFITEYGTHDTARRDVLYKLVKELKAKGVPIDGVGHQMHINREMPSIASIVESIKLFGELGLDNQLTELDVSVYTDNATAYQKVPQELIVQQGYRYRVNLQNLQSFGSNGEDKRFKSAAKVVSGGYIVEAAIPFKTIKGAIGLIIGFDTEVNDACSSGSRQAVVTWSDPVGNDYRDTGKFGCLLMIK